MKTLHYSIIAVLIFIILVTLIIEFPIYRGPNALIVPSKPHIEDANTLHGLPDYNIGLVFNGTQSSRDAPFYVKQGQNLTLVASITSNPTNLPVSLDIDSHVGFTKTNGIDSRLSDAKINTPEQVMIYISTSKDATPNTYQILVRANNTLMGMDSNFYVKVYPSDENKITTVVVNDSKILGPCEVFGMPCPNNPVFTAQKSGPDIYIEKVTVNSIDHYAIVRPDRYCVYPPSYNGFKTCRNEDDLALLRLVGVDTSIPQENVSIMITGLNSTYSIGEPIDFGIHIKGYGRCSFPSVLVITEGNIVWQSKAPMYSCFAGMLETDRKYTIQDMGGPFSLNQKGTYTVHVDYDSNYTENQFNTISSEGLPPPNHVTNVKNNDPFGIIALVIYHPPDVCLGPCPPNTFYLKINSKSPAYLRGYNICDDDSCTKRDDLSVLLPINDILKPDFKMIPLPEDLRWKYGDAVHIQLEVSPISDTKTALLIDHGNSTIVP